MLAYWADVSPAGRTADAEAAIFQPSIDFRTFELQFHTLEVKVLFGFLDAPALAALHLVDWLAKLPVPLRALVADSSQACHQLLVSNLFVCCHLCWPCP